MCGKQEDPAEEAAKRAREAEQRRQGLISQGKSQIDNRFSGFTDSFYGGLSKQYGDYQLPQLDTQYNDAVETKTKQLATAGLLGSSVAGDQLGDLRKTYETERGAVGNRAVDYANEQRSNVERERGNLYAQLNSTADPSGAAAAAATSAAALSTPSSISPLAAIFQNFTAQAADAVQAQRAGYRGTGIDLFGSGGGTSRGSTRVVR
jgi:hypothetical protein